MGNVNIIHKECNGPIVIPKTKQKSEPDIINPNKKTLDIYQNIEIKRLENHIDNVEESLDSNVNTLNNRIAEIETVNSTVIYDINDRLNQLISDNLLEHNYYIPLINVNQDNNNVWSATDQRITTLKDGLSLTIIAPTTVTNQNYMIRFQINDLSQGYIIYDINNLSKKFSIRQGAIVQLIGLYINGVFYYLVISDSKRHEVVIGNEEPSRCIGTLWFDTDN